MSADLNDSQTRTVDSGGFGDAKFAPGRVIDDKYRIVNEIAHGGMGAVYRAEQIMLSRDVAIKVLRCSLDSEHDRSEFARRFRTEATILAKIRHPNAVSVHDFGFAFGRPYLVLELVEGRSLRAMLGAKERFSLETILRIGCQVCAAVGHAHKLQVVHRDLKPDNIMVSEDPDGAPRATVLDFGVARIRDVNAAESRITQQGLVVGTPQYMSPEQFQGQEADARSDIYALGVILYELVCGALPYESDSAISLAMKHLNEPAPRLSTRNVQIPLPDELEKMIYRCLEKKPGDRPQSTEELGNELAKLRGDILEHVPETPSRRAAPWSFARKLPRSPRVAAALFSVPLLAFTAMPTWSWSKPTVKPAEPTITTAPALTDDDLTKLLTKVQELAADRRHLETIEILKPAVALRPDSPELSRALADIYTTMGNFAAAKETLVALLRQKPDDRKAHNQLGYVESSLGDHIAALQAYQKAIELGHETSIVYNNLGVEFQKTGQHSEAIHAFKKAIGMDPLYLRAFYNLADSYERTANWEKAVLTYRIAVKIDTKNPTAYRKLATALMQAGRPEEAQLETMNAMRLYPGFKDFEDFAKSENLKVEE